MAQSVFGVGFLFATPQGATPTPTRFGRLQDVSVDFAYDTKLLYGSNQYPLEQARGKAKIDLKASIGVVDPNLFNNLYFGLTTAAGETLNSVDEAATPSASNTGFIVANSATFSQDLGLYNTVTGLRMTRVTNAPGPGQYALTGSPGLYTCNPANFGQLCRVSYTYASPATGTNLAFTNQVMGSTVVFQVQLVNRFRGSDGVLRSLYLNFPAVQCAKLSMPLKLDDFTLPQLEMSAQDNGAGNVFNYSMTG